MECSFGAFTFYINLKLTRRWGEATRFFIRMRQFFKTGVIKPEELLSTFQKKQKNEFICMKLVIVLIFCNEKVMFIDFWSNILNKSLPYY